MTPTWTLQDEHFEFFSGEPTERDPALRSKITELLGSLWGAVAQKVGPDRFREVFGEYRVGNLGEGDNYAWAQTNDDARPRFDLPNLTIEIDKDELSLNVVGVFHKQAGHVYRWLVATGGRALAASCYELVVRRVTGRRVGPHGTKVMWRGAKQEEVDRVHLSDLQTTTIDARLADWRERLDDPPIQHLGFHIRKAWNRTNAIDRKGLPGILADEIERLIPAVAEIRIA